MNTFPLADPAPEVTPCQFSVASFIQQGGAGKVYSGTWIARRNQKVALKFFGYTKREPNMREIDEEIDLLQSLRGVTGIVQLEAIFEDPPCGFVQGKVFRRIYPCIVMELLEGGELFDKIECSETVSEKDLALIFRGIVLALDSLHQRRYVHRDVKLENLMLADKTPKSAVKIIDVGMMVRMAPNKNYYRSSSIQGTVGYVAPETLLHKMYSPASDMWQAGVCLYSMLSGFSPFHPKHPEQITEHTYFPMKGVGWDNISDAAKDLISRILVRNVPDRITAQQILQHPWVTTEKAARVDLGSEYFLRIKHLGIRQKMKTFFVENNIEEGNRLRRDHLRMVMPSLHSKNRGDVTTSLSTSTSTSTSSVQAGRNPSSCSSSSSQEGVSATDGATAEAASIAHIFGSDPSDFNAKLKQLKRAVLRRHSAQRSMRLAHTETSSKPMPTTDSVHLPPPPPPALPRVPATGAAADDSTIAIAPERCASFGGEINYETYLQIINQCDLPELANRQVFSIFDIGNTGTINPKDFLLTILAFKPEDETSAIAGSGEEAARLYFNIFDINEVGSIDLEELKVAAAVLLEEESLPAGMVVGESVTTTSAASSIEDLFAAIDVGKDGRIDFDEFKVFYETVLIYSTTRRSITMVGSPGIEHGDEDDKYRT